QYFFSKQKSNFFSLWGELRLQYPDEFWVVFWSEQLWQAIVFCEEASRNGAARAKSLVNRLPFSFMQKDWQSYKNDELISAHDFLYSIDYSLKNSAGTFGIDLFVHKFIHKDFDA